MTLCIERIRTLDDIRAFLDGNVAADITPHDRKAADALLLAEVAEAFGQLSGPATKRILWRMYHVFGDKRFERLAGISNGHIYNLRARRAYRRARTTFRTTRTAPSPIGQRRRPRPEGRPGFVRVDTVHVTVRPSRGRTVVRIVLGGDW